MYPKRVDKFTKWSKAMVEGATVDKPSYPGTTQPMKSSGRGKPRPKRKRRHGSKRKRRKD